MEKEIELLEETPTSNIEKIATTTIKKVGIPLAIIIEIAFLSLAIVSYKLNQDLEKLSEEVARSEDVLSQMGETRETLTKTQQKLRTIASAKELFCYPCAIRKIEELTTSLSRMEDVLITDGEVQLSAEAPPGPNFAYFISGLLEEESIKEVVLTSGRLNKEGVFTFTINLVFIRDVLENE